jgi:hypothetical protein
MNENDYYTHKAKELLTDAVSKRLDKLEAQCAGLLMTVRNEIDDLQGQVELLNARLDGQIKMLQESVTQEVKQPTNWKIYDCCSCMTTQCEYMWDECSIGKCGREEAGGKGREWP